MIYEPGISDRRESRRYTYQAIVECTSRACKTVPPSGGKYFSALTQNVSRNGIGLYSISAFVPGHEMEVRFETSSGNGFTRYLVCWVQKVGPEYYLAGLQRIS